MNGDLILDGYVLPRDVRSAGLTAASERWSGLAYGAALAFVANLYTNPAFYWPVLEQVRFGVVTAGICAFAVLMRRVTSGEPLRLGGPPAVLLFGYGASVVLSLAWTLSTPRTMVAIAEIAKLFIVYVALVNTLDSPRRLRTFLIVAALATLGPSLGGIQRWLENDHLVDGYRTYARGDYADPNHLAMGLVLLLPATLLMIQQTARPAIKVLLAFAAAANVTALVLTHSRSGAVAMAVALAFTFLRGRRKGRGLLLAGVVLAGLVALAPQSFWKRSESIATYEEDVSFGERERAWKMLKVIFQERPLTGVGANAFVASWDRFAPLSAGGRHLIAHNIFMEILGELGLVALLLFGTFVGWLLWRLWFAGMGASGVDALAVFAGLLGYMIIEMVNGYARSFNLYMMLGVAVAALAQARMRARLSEPDQRFTATTK